MMSIAKKDSNIAALLPTPGAGAGHPGGVMRGSIMMAKAKSGASASHKKKQPGILQIVSVSL